MTEKSNVRMASPADAPGILSLFRMSHDEDGIFTLAEDLVMERLDAAFRKQDGIVGVIGNDHDALEGGIYLAISRPSFTKDFYLSELWNYVHPDHRRTRHAVDLIEFAKRCSADIGLPMIAGLVSNTQTEAKVRLYQRELGEPAGAFFVHGLQRNNPATSFWGTAFGRAPRGGKRVRRKRIAATTVEAIRP